MLSDKSIIIIGAGLAGLSTGCYAQMNGYCTRIFEHHTMPGGVAATWKRKEYNIDGGIHFLMGHKPGQPLYDLYCELGTAQVNRFIDLTTYGRFIDETSTKRIDITSDLNHLAIKLKEMSPNDTRTIDDLIAGAHNMQGFTINGLGMNNPPELQGTLGQINNMWRMRRVSKYFTGKFNRPVSEYVQSINDPWLRDVICNIFLPEIPVWFLFMILGLLADGQMGLVEGGSLNFVLPIEKRYKNLGGNITYRATVEKILVKNDQAVGVLLSNGSKHYADIIVSAADGYSTIFKMLERRYIDKKIKNRYARWKLTKPLIMVNFGVSRSFNTEPWLQVIKLQHPFMVGNQIVEGVMIRIFNYSTQFAPAGKTVVQVSFETEWDQWNNWQKDKAYYEAQKQHIAAEILKRLEIHYHGISSQVSMIDVATPYTTWRYTLNHKGAYEGWLPTPEIITTHMKKTLPGLKSFYMAGQWVMPGGGVPPCLYSGRHVVQILCKHDRKQFLTTFP